MFNAKHPSLANLSVAGTVLLMLLMAVTADKASAGGYPWVSIDGTQFACSVAENAGAVTLYVYVAPTSGGVQSLTLTAPIPECYGGSVTDVVLYPYTGDPQTGAAITLPSCVSVNPVLLMIRDVVIDQATSPCCNMWVEFTNVIDCVGGSDYNSGSNALLAVDGVCNTVTQIFNVSPADGATNVSLGADLIYQYKLAAYCPPTPSSPLETFYFGTDPENLGLSSPNTGTSEFVQYDPGTLEPNTTYYWKAYVGWAYGSGETPVMSFTTVGLPIPAESRTWGAIKALFDR